MNKKLSMHVVSMGHGEHGTGMHGERNKVWVGWSVKSMWCREKDMVGVTHGHARSCNQHLVFH